MNDEILKQIVTRVIQNYMKVEMIPIEASARHIHISKEHAIELFGGVETLTKKKDLSQPNQHQYNERVALIGPKGAIHGVAVLGPSRGSTQVELSKTDAMRLGIDPPVRESGDLKGSGAIVIATDRGVVRLGEGVIIAKRHLHMTPTDAERFCVADKDIVKVKVYSDRPIIFEEVTVRVSENYRLNMHIDYDEANACSYTHGVYGKIIACEIE